MSAVKFFLFGKFCFQTNRKLIYKIETHKARELLVYLLLYRDKQHSREQLADVLWGGVSTTQSKNYLRKALWQLQSNLETNSSQNLLLVEGEWLVINPNCDLWLDVAILEDAFKTTQGVRGQDLQIDDYRRIQEAVNLYRGELLENWYQDWCLYERERLQYLYLALLDKLMGYCEAHGEYEKGLLYGERILCKDKAHERAHRRSMRLHYLAGNRTFALRQFQKCTVSLRDELDVDPSESTRLLYETICNDQNEVSSQANEIEIRNIDREPLKVVLNHLDLFHKKLRQMQSQLTQDIQAIQKTLKQDRP